MGIEYKSVAVGGVQEVTDEGDGVVTAYVSVTGVEDNVKDIIEPGAYTKTLDKRKPKGVWGHSWTTPTSRTLDAKELMPGDPNLPKELSDGTPWPKEAGALQIKMQFNLETRRGREAYSDVKFFDADQEWSIGYSVPDGKSAKDAQGRRRIKELDLFEYSAVLFGANTHARTKSVKDAQLSVRGLSQLELKSYEDAIALWRKENPVAEPEGDGSDFEGDEPTNSGEDLVPDGDDEVDEEEFDTDESYEDDDDDELDEAEAEEKAIELLAKTMGADELRQAYDVIGKVLDALNPMEDKSAHYMEMGYKALLEAKATGFDTISAAVEAIDVTLDPSDAKALQDAAADLDDALADKDDQAAVQAATDLFDTLEVVMEDEPDNVSLKAVAKTVADKSGGKPEDDDAEDEEEDEEGDEENDDWEEDDDEKKPNAYKKTKSFTFTASNGVEYKSVPVVGREFGAVLGGEDLEAKERVQAYVGTLPNEALVSLHYVLADERGNNTLKTFVVSEIEAREEAGVLSTEVKMNIGRSMGGQHGRGGGRHRQAAEGRTPGPGKNFGETGPVAKKPAKALKRGVKGVKKLRKGKTTVNRITGTDKPVQRMKTKSLDPNVMNRAASLKGEKPVSKDKTVVIDTTELKGLDEFLRQG